MWLKVSEIWLGIIIIFFFIYIILVYTVECIIMQTCGEKK